MNPPSRRQRPHHLGPTRRRGIARRLVGEVPGRAGGLRIDLITRSGGFYLGLGACRAPGFRLTRECLGLGGNDAPATHGLRGNDRAAMNEGL